MKESITEPSRSMSPHALKPVTTYRMRPHFRNAGLTALFVSGGMGSMALVAVADEGADPLAPQAMVMVALILTGFIALGVWLLLAYAKSRLSIGESEVRQIGILREKSVHYQEVRQLFWRRIPKGGSVRLDGDGTCLKIELGSFSKADRAAIVDHLRKHIDVAQQKDWREFCEHFDDSPARRSQARRIYAVLTLFMLANAVGFLIIWLLGLGGQYLPLSLINFAMTVYCAHGYRKHRADTTVDDTTTEPAANDELTFSE